MPYEINEYRDAEAIMSAACARPPLGPGFTKEQAEGATRLRVIGSSVRDPGEDYVEFILTTKNGKEIKKKIRGF